MQHSVIKILIDGENLYYICNPYDFDQIQHIIDHTAEDSILDTLNDLLQRRMLVSIEEMVSQEYSFDVESIGWKEYWKMKKGITSEVTAKQSALF